MTIMYSWEIYKFLEERNYYIGGDDLIFITDVNQHPQINHIVYNAYEHKYEMWDKEGSYFCFWAMPYTEAIEKGLVKTKTLKK